MSNPKIPTITVGELRRALSLYSDDAELSFGGLEFYRVKSRGEHLAQIEFNQAVYLDSNGKKVARMQESYWVPSVKLKDREQISKLLSKYGQADRMLEEIEWLVGSAMGRIFHQVSLLSPTQIHDEVNELAIALTTIERIFGESAGATRALFYGEAEADGLLPQLVAFEAAIRGAHGMLARIAERTREDAARYLRRGSPPKVETAVRRWLVERIANVTRPCGLEWRRNGDFGALIELVWKSTFPSQDADSDIRGAMRIWR